MALAAKLQLRQSQSLVMTPQLMQSIRLLQFTHVELEHFIDEEIERNPLLERAEPQDDAASDQMQKIEAEPQAAAEGDWFENEAGWSAEAISEKLDTSLENLFPDDPGTSERLGPDLTAQWKSASGNGGGSSSEGLDAGDMAAARGDRRTAGSSRSVAGRRQTRRCPAAHGSVRSAGFRG